MPKKITQTKNFRAMPATLFGCPKEMLFLMVVQHDKKVDLISKEK
jgi:hypothetical protein